MKLVTQKSPMGCAVAATASFLKLDYDSTLKLFDNGKIRHAVYGFFVYDIVKALKKRNVLAKAFNVRGKKIKFKTGDIVFSKDKLDDPFGHYLLKTPKGWMDSWKNFPSMTPARAGYRKKLSGDVLWVIRKGELRQSGLDPQKLSANVLPAPKKPRLRNRTIFQDTSRQNNKMLFLTP
jgi:hypothetical protein